MKKTFSANCLRKSRENFAGGRSPSFLLLIEEKKQKKIKAGAPAGEVCR